VGIDPAIAVATNLQQSDKVNVLGLADAYEFFKIPSESRSIPLATYITLCDANDGHKSNTTSEKPSHSKPGARDWLLLAAREHLGKRFRFLYSYIHLLVSQSSITICYEKPDR
jgi:hypothetical protein